MYLDHHPTIFDLYSSTIVMSEKNNEEEDEDCDKKKKGHGGDDNDQNENDEKKDDKEEEEEIDIDPIAIRKLFQRISTIFTLSHTSSLLSSPISQFMVSHPLLTVVSLFLIFSISSLGQIPFLGVIGLWLNGWLGRGERDHQLTHTLPSSSSASSLSTAQQQHHLLNISEVDHIKLRMEGEILYERDVGLISHHIHTSHVISWCYHHFIFLTKVPHPSHLLPWQRSKS